MIDASKLPRVPSAQVQKNQQQTAEYARAPAGPDAPAPQGRPPAVQKGSR